MWPFKKKEIKNTHQFYRKCKYTGKFIIGHSYTPESGCLFDVLMQDLELIQPLKEAGWKVREIKYI